MSNFVKKKTFFTAGLICSLLLLVSFFGDLKISNIAINYSSWFGTLFQTFGEFPVYFIFVLSGEILIAYSIRKKASFFFFPILLGGIGISLWQAKSYSNEVLSYILSIMSNIENHKEIGLANSDSNVMQPSIFLSVVTWIGIYTIVTLLSQYWLNKKDDNQLENLLKIAVFASLTVFLSLEVNHALKDFWGRVRPYELSSSQKEFTSWIYPNGINGHKSFPSGHTMAATLMIVFSWFSSSRTNHKRLWTFGIAYGALMGISRVIIGAHFVSDVVFSYFLTAFIIYIIREIYTCLNLSDDI
ncbi:phosphatase PAP2 family protein [Enterococcus faecalis]|nr:phosphatase PAP2 family protein [Enterococcus faecalis]